MRGFFFSFLPQRLKASFSGILMMRLPVDPETRPTGSSSANTELHDRIPPNEHIYFCWGLAGETDGAREDDHEGEERAAKEGRLITQ